MREKHFHFDKDCFVFPFAIVWKTDFWELVGKHSRLEIHFLWFHWRWIFKRGVTYDYSRRY